MLTLRFHVAFTLIALILCISCEGNRIRQNDASLFMALDQFGKQQYSATLKTLDVTLNKNVVSQKDYRIFALRGDALNHLERHDEAAAEYKRAIELFHAVDIDEVSEMTGMKPEIDCIILEIKLNKTLHKEKWKKEEIMEELKDKLSLSDNETSPSKKRDLKF